MNTFQIFCDKGRENGVITCLEQIAECPLVIKQINVGDFCIATTNGKILVTIERKTWTDLADTVKDAKRRANHKKLLDLRNTTGCRIVYIIEGTMSPSVDRKFHKVPFDSLEAYLDHVMIRDGCAVIQTANIQDTARRIYSMTKHLATIEFKDAIIIGGKELGAKIIDNDKDKSDKDNKEDKSDNDNDMSETHLLKKSQRAPDEAVKEKIWTSMKGITIVSLPAVSAKYTISQILNEEINVGELALLTYPSGNKFGTKRAKEILGNGKLHASAKKVHNKMLTQIHGITKETARIILNKYDLREITAGNITKEQIAAIVKKTTILKGEIKNKIIGNAIAERIIKLL